MITWGFAFSAVSAAAHLLTNVSFSLDAHTFEFYLNESASSECTVTPLNIDLFPGTSFHASVHVRPCNTQCQFDSSVLIESLLCKSNTELCDAGKLNDFNSSYRCDVNCPAGYFCATPFPYNNDTALLEANRYSRVYQCAAGTCCDEATTEPLACQRTQYCPRAYNQNCNESNLACPIGFYCPDGKLRLPCPAGFFCNATSLGNYTDHPCPAGKYCPSPGTIKPAICPSDKSCDVGSVIPQYCKEGEYLKQAVAGYFTCVDCYPGRYCNGMNFPPQVCNAAGFCPTSRSCMTGLDCVRVNGVSPPCNLNQHTICDVAFYVRTGRRDVLRESNQTLLIQDGMSYQFDVDTENAQHVQVVMQNSSSHQVWINCVNTLPALHDFIFVGDEGGGLALMVTNCALDSNSLQFVNVTGSILVVLGNGVTASTNAFVLNEEQTQRTTILMRDGAKVDALATWPFISDVFASIVPTRAPTTHGSNTQEPTAQNLSTTVAVAITVSILCLAILAFAQHRFKLWYRSKGLTVAIMPGANTLIGEIQMTEIQRQQQQREDEQEQQQRSPA